MLIDLGGSILLQAPKRHEQSFHFNRFILSMGIMPIRCNWLLGVKDNENTIAEFRKSILKISRLVKTTVDP